MPTSVPKEINEILASLSKSESQRVEEYIASLHAQIETLGGSVDEPMDAEADEASGEDTEKSGADVEDDGFIVPQYESGEDYEKQSDCKASATEAKNSGNLDEALKCYNEAVLAAPPSALLYANRSIVLEKLGHYKAAEVDCEMALKQNPDSAKALKTRGKLRYMHLDDWEGALRDLSQAQSLDFDPEIADILKELTKRRIEKEKEEAHERIEKEEKLRKKAEDIKRAREEAKREQAESAARGAGMGGMPGGMGGMPGGMPGGMGGMPGMPSPDMMSGMMNDPEIKKAMENPKVVEAFQEIMSGPGGPMGLLSNPGKLQELMADPEVGPALNLMMKKMMGGGGMPGMGGMGGMPSAGGGSDDGIPDMDAMPDLD
mmetsp:Transcript_15119/g.34619  ORF Transcript_15119/g.34619 Transcript_15119/m.34619 type:complete len:374 (+) Transcript_15119:157-1278(+)